MLADDRRRFAENRRPRRLDPDPVRLARNRRIRPMRLVGMARPPPAQRVKDDDHLSSILLAIRIRLSGEAYSRFRSKGPLQSAQSTPPPGEAVPRPTQTATDTGEIGGQVMSPASRAMIS